MLIYEGSAWDRVDEGTLLPNTLGDREGKIRRTKEDRGGIEPLIEE